MSESQIAVLGASGLIGYDIACRLVEDGFTVLPVARRFTPVQRAEFHDRVAQIPVASLDEDSLRLLLSGTNVVVNCLGVLQDGVDLVHRVFLEKLLKAMPDECLIIHLSIPGDESGDRTAYSVSKRQGEKRIEASGRPFVILRPGFVVAPTAYGGSALMRALAALPVTLARREADERFAAIGITDLSATVSWLARRRRAGIRTFSSVWDVMEREPHRMGEVAALFRQHFGGPPAWFTAPSWTMDFGALGGDLLAWAGWRSPIRSTTVAELRRGVTGDPAPWIAATGIEPAPLEKVLARLPAGVQERWFARLFLLKALILIVLALFWIASGVIALASFGAATAILTAHGWAARPAEAFTVAGSVADIGVGIAIALRRSCRAGLIAGIVLALGYVAGCAVLIPELWLDPLGALVKTGPAIVLMLVALVLLDER
jgi:nucleoside-diphosphate-sugar epimerase